jgi:cation transport regulator ChaB
VEGWGKIAAGVVLGVAGTVYATNKEVRKRLPKSARDLPENVRHRFESAVSAAREASRRRREEILRDLEAHEAHTDRATRPRPEGPAVNIKDVSDERDEIADESAEKTEGGSV